MEAKHFLKGLTWLLLLNLLIKPAWIFVIDRQVQNIVGHEAYGVYFSLFNLCYVLLFIADAGLSNMLTQRLAATERLNVRQLLKLKAVLLLLYALACLGMAVISGISQWHLLFYLVGIQGLNSLFLFLRSILAARQVFTTDAIFSVLDKWLLFLLCIGPVYGLFRPMTILLFLQLQAISITVATVSLVMVLLKKRLLIGGDSIAPKTVLLWVAPFAVLILFMSAHNRLDAFLLERLHAEGAKQAGIYALAYRLLDAANMVGYLTASFLVPFLSRNRHRKDLLRQSLLYCRHGLLLLSAVVTGFVFVFAPWLQQVLYHTSDAYSITIIRLSLATLPAYYLIHVYGSALTATTHLRLFICIVLIAALLNAALNGWLIPLYGAMGCCVAALTTQYGCGITLWIMASRRLGIPYAAGSAIRIVLAALCLLLLFLAAHKLTENVWIILSSIALLAAVFLLTQRSFLKKVFFSFYK